LVLSARLWKSIDYATRKTTLSHGFKY
jgi:hypothetical protein